MFILSLRYASPYQPLISKPARHGRQEVKLCSACEQDWYGNVQIWHGSGVEVNSSQKHPNHPGSDPTEENKQYAHINYQINHQAERILGCKVTVYYHNYAGRISFPVICWESKKETNLV